MIKFNLNKTANGLEVLICYEIYTSLPDFEEEEKKLFDEINSSVPKKKEEKEEKRIEFYDFVKKKYVNYPVLSHFSYDSLNNFYILKYLYEGYKGYFTSDFDFVLWLYDFFKRDKQPNHSQEQFRMYFLSRFRFLKAEKELPGNQFSILNVDTDFVNNIVKGNHALINILKYVPDYFGKTFMINIYVYYPGQLQDIKSIFHSNVGFTDLIVNIKITEKNKRNFHSKYINEILLLILTQIPRYQNLKSLSINLENPDEEKHYIFNETNSSCIITHVLKNSKINIFICSGIDINSSYQKEIITDVYKSRQLKFLFFDEVKFKKDFLIEFIDIYKEKDKNFKMTNQLCLIRFDEINRYENFYTEKIEEDLRMRYLKSQRKNDGSSLNLRKGYRKSIIQMEYERKGYTRHSSANLNKQINNHL